MLECFFDLTETWVLNPIRKFFREIIKFFIKGKIEKKHSKYARSQLAMVRSICAEFGYDLNILQNDSSAYVRIEVVKRGYNLRAIMEKEKEYSVRGEVTDYLNRKSICVYNFCNPGTDDSCRDCHRSYNYFIKNKDLSSLEPRDTILPETEIENADCMENYDSKKIKEYIQQIHTLHCSNVKMEDKIQKITDTLSQICSLIDENPERAKKCNRLSKYYLPTTMELLKRYQAMEQISRQNRNILKSKSEIENAVDMILEAFQNLENDLTDDIPIEVKSNVDVLHTLMVQDGLLESKGSQSFRPS